MNIQLSDRFNYKRLIRFTFPSVLMMVFTSIYGVVDGFFVSNYVGKTPFAAVNFIMPFLMVVGVLGFMFGTGGSALVAKTLGEGKIKKAQEIFSFLVYITIISGVIIAIISIIFLKPIAIFLGAGESLVNDCVLYGRIILAALPFLMLQYAFSSFVITAERPQLGLIMSIVAGVLNITGDFLFISVLDMGITGAALATALGQVVGGIIPVVYFCLNKSLTLSLGKFKWDKKALMKTCTNGSSEFMSNASMSVIGMLYNFQLMKYAGENGVAAYGTIMYVNFIFLAIFIGYSTGIAPVISYHFGAKNVDELKSLFKKSCIIISVCSLAMFVISECLSYPIGKMFVGYDRELFSMTVYAFIIYSVSFLFSGVVIFGSAFFTALNDGLTSALISFLRTMVFQIVAVLILPLIWELNGIWYSIVASEIMAAIATVVFLIIKRKKYMYF